MAPLTGAKGLFRREDLRMSDSNSHQLPSSRVAWKNQIVAPVGLIYDSHGSLIKRFSDGLPASIKMAVPATARWFELEVAGERIRQNVPLLKK